MVHAQMCKKFIVTSPGALIDDASATTNEIDTLGYDYVTIDCIFGATDIALTALKVQQSDASGSGHADVTGLVYGTSLDIAGATSALPIDTDDNKVFSFEIDMRGKKRYLDVVATFGNGSVGGYIAIIANLWRAKDGPTTAAERGCANILRV